MKGGDLNVVISIEYDDNQLVRRIKKDFRFNVLKSKKKTILKQINQTNKERKKNYEQQQERKKKKLTPQPSSLLSSSSSSRKRTNR